MSTKTGPGSRTEHDSFLDVKEFLLWCREFNFAASSVSAYGVSVQLTDLSPQVPERRKSSDLITKPTDIIQEYGGDLLEQLAAAEVREPMMEDDENELEEAPHA